jgi:phosphoglycerol transferase MdoB-like AlkP superfamily enzyme
VEDEDAYTVLMTQKRKTLVTTFARHGYATAAVMPGLQSAWPEGAFYGFDHIYAGADLDYRGPGFGWWSVPDQYTFAWIDRHEIAPRSRPPVFVVFPTITSHTPFSPIAPYQADWSRLLTDMPYDEPAVELAMDESPDWMNLGPSYVGSLKYEFQTFGGYLRLRPDRDLVMILIGDHQPPSAVSGEHASREVPVHVIASRPAVLDALVAQGFRRGLTPSRPAVGRMNDFTRILLNAF